MFDDQIPGGGGQVPNNLPVGEPEDMFDGVDPVAEVPSIPTVTEEVVTPATVMSVSESPIQEAQTASVVEPPIETSAVTAGKLRPSVSPEVAIPTPIVTPEIPAVSATVPPIDLPQMDTLPELSSLEGDKLQGPSFFRSVLVILIVIGIALVIGGIVWFVYATFIATPKVIAPLPVAPAVVDFVEDPVVEIIEEEPFEDDTLVIPSDRATTTRAETIADIAEDQILFGEPVDTDDDQLDDDREIEFGTDPRNWDTDGDNLSDGEELLNWGTDPLSPDTDGDGFDDGDEVQSGYSPTQAGGARLFEVAPVATTTATSS